MNKPLDLAFCRAIFLPHYRRYVRLLLLGFLLLSVLVTAPWFVGQLVKNAVVDAPAGAVLSWLSLLLAAGVLARFELLRGARREAGLREAALGDRALEHALHLPMAWHDAANPDDVADAVVRDSGCLTKTVHDVAMEWPFAVMAVALVPTVIVLEPGLVLPLACLLLVAFVSMRLQLPASGSSSTTLDVPDRVKRVAAVLRYVSEMKTLDPVPVTGTAKKPSPPLLRQVLLEAATMSAALWLMGAVVIHTTAGGQSAASLAMSLSYAVVAMPGLKALAVFWLTWPRFFAAVERLSNLFSATAESSPGRLRFNGVNRSLRYRDISFAYPGCPALIEGVSLRIPVGRPMALTGAKGSGRTTLAGLVPGYNLPLEGYLQVDSVDTRDLALSSLRSLISWVPASPGIIPGSLLDNVRLARRDAKREEVMAALEAAQARVMIQGLKDGIDTWLGPDGVSLSPAEQQLVGFARMFLAARSIVILDEATSELDKVTERALVGTLAPWLESRVALIITERPALLAIADRIMVLEGGRVSETAMFPRDWRL